LNKQSRIIIIESGELNLHHRKLSQVFKYCQSPDYFQTMIRNQVKKTTTTSLKLNITRRRNKETKQTTMEQQIQTNAKLLLISRRVNQIFRICKLCRHRQLCLSPKSTTILRNMVVKFHEIVRFITCKLRKVSLYNFVIGAK